MAIKLTSTYAKKLGLPSYSSHSFSATVEVEVTDLTGVPAQVHQLYELLQDSVDREITNVGYLPRDQQEGLRVNRRQPQNGGHEQGRHEGGGSPGRNHSSWSCSEKQRKLILELIERLDMDLETAQQLSNEQFGRGLRQLDRKQASELISDLLSRKPSATGGNQNR